MMWGTRLPELRAESGAVVTETDRGSCWGSSNWVRTCKGGVLWACGRMVRRGGLEISGDSVSVPTTPWGICGKGRIFMDIRGNSIFTDDGSDGSVLSRELLDGYPIANGSDIRRVDEKGSWLLRCIEPEDDDVDEGFGPVCRTDEPREEAVISRKE